MKNEIIKYITGETLFSVNYAGYATLFTKNNKSIAYESKNKILNFIFRDRQNSADLDGTDFFTLTAEEVEHIINSFDFEEIRY